MNATPILFNRHEKVGEIVLNRPQAYNALNGEMISLLSEQLDAWEHDKTIAAVIIRSTHDKVFCAGGDIKQVYEEGKKNASNVLDFFKLEYKLNAQIKNYPKPYIALLNGLTFGGGAGISIYASHRIASENFAFAMPETAIGFFPDIGASYFLTRGPDALGLYLGLTGTRINACEAKTMQLIDYPIANTHFPALLSGLLTLNDYSPENLSQYFSNFPPLKQTSTLPLRDINTCFEQTTLESIFSSLEKNNSEWATHTLANLQKKSPLSLAITFEEFQRGKHLDFSQCQQMEYRLLKHFLTHPDFYEGVRAAVIDKDQQPKWQSQKIENISRDLILQFFRDSA